MATPYTTLVLYEPDETEYPYMAYCAELPGCMSDGHTPKEAQESLEEAIELWLSVLREFGDPIPPPHPFTDMVCVELHADDAPTFRWSPC